MANDLATKLRVELDNALAREAILQTAVNDLCKLQELQEEIEESGRPGPRPDWGDAWEQAFAVRWGASEAATALLEQLENVEAVLLRELAFWSDADELENDLVNAVGDGWKCWLSGEQRAHADRAREICSSYEDEGEKA